MKNLWFYLCSEFGDYLEKSGVNLASPAVQKAFISGLENLAEGRRIEIIENAIKAFAFHRDSWRKSPEHLFCMALLHHWEPPFKALAHQGKSRL